MDGRERTDDYGRVIRSLRQQKDMSQQDLADAVGAILGYEVSRTVVAKLEGGQGRMPRDRERRLAFAEALGTTHEAIVRDAERLAAREGRGGNLAAPPRALA
jgi:transcriptional regulator with XRE-family HTH domain